MRGAGTQGRKRDKSLQQLGREKRGKGPELPRDPRAAAPAQGPVLCWPPRGSAVDSVLRAGSEGADAPQHPSVRAGTRFRST